MIVANHNSHLDALVMLALLPLSDLPKVKVVAAKDYFCCNPVMEWFSVNILGIIPLDRSGGVLNPLEPVFQALEEEHTVILFPEGSRGEPEQSGNLRFGIAKIIETCPHLAVTPVYIYGLGKSLPRGDFVLVPFVCEMNIGPDLVWTGDKAGFITRLQSCFDGLKRELDVLPWV